MMIIILKRISRCLLGIVKLYLSFFWWLYRFNMGRNDQNKLEAVEHDYFEAETSFVSVCDKIVLIKVEFQSFFYHFVEFDVANEISSFF